MVPIIGAIAQIRPTTYRLERRNPKTGQIMSSWAVFRDAYEVGQKVRWGYGAHWTVVEVRQ